MKTQRLAKLRFVVLLELVGIAEPEPISGGRRGIESSSEQNTLLPRADTVLRKAFFH